MPADELEYGFVADRVVLAVGDSADPDRLPDIVPAKGSVIFTPVVNLQRTKVTPATVIRSAIECTINGSTGELVDPAEHVGNVALVTGHYTVSYRLSQGTVPSFPIEVTTAHTEEEPLWLPLYAHIQPTPTQRWVVNEQVYLDTIAARDATIAIVEDLNVEQAVEDYLTENPPDGIIGPPGADGPQGEPGPPGERGPEGPEGPPGADGTDGEQGPPGMDGEEGPQGPPGQDGIDGEDGEEGPQGEPGPPGQDGVEGPQGEPGPPGVDGEQGPPGQEGPEGPPGADGAEGPQGPPGADGADGAPGADGEQGPPGEDGERGLQGEPGADGAPGEPGPPGIGNLVTISGTGERVNPSDGSVLPPYVAVLWVSDSEPQSMVEGDLWLQPSGQVLLGADPDPDPDPDFSIVGTSTFVPTSTASTRTVAVPSGTQAGDLIIAAVSQAGGSSTSEALGMSLYHRQSFSGHSAYLFTKTAESNDAGTDITVTSSNPLRVSVVVFVLRGAVGIGQHAINDNLSGVDMTSGVLTSVGTSVEFQALFRTGGTDGVDANAPDEVTKLAEATDMSSSGSSAVCVGYAEPLAPTPPGTVMGGDSWPQATPSGTSVWTFAVEVA